jgi:hypothetical protein
LASDADAIFADGEGHRPERADGRGLHQDRDEAEHDMFGRFDHHQQWRGAIADQRQRDARQDRDQQHLKDLAFGQRANRLSG